MATNATRTNARTANTAKGGTKAQALAQATANDESEGDEGTTGVSAWARELARAHGGETARAGNRFYKLADYFASVAKPGETVSVSFAKANEGAALNRGATGDPAASWRLAVQRTRQLFGGTLPMGIEAKVLADEGKIAITMPSAK